MSRFPGDLRAPAALRDRFHPAGLWRPDGPVADLRWWTRESPDATAIIQYRRGTFDRRLTYAELAVMVERFSAALTELDVGPGDVVLVLLPNVWQVSALLVACARIGAVLAPVMPATGTRELRRILPALDPKVVVTVDESEGARPARTIAAIAAGGVPRAVIGRPIHGEIDFGEFFERTPWERRHTSWPAEDPDRAALLLLTSGTSGRPKKVVHSSNTLYAGVSPIAREERIGPGDVLTIPHTFAWIGGILYGIALPLLTGAVSVLLDEWDGPSALRILRETGASAVFAAPSFFATLVRAAGEKSHDLPSLRLAVSGGTSVPPSLVRKVPGTLNTRLRTLWGMTELAAHTWTRAGDPVDWGTRSDGSPGSGLEVDLRPTASEISREQPARLYIRGAGVALATWDDDNQDGPRVLADHDDGWYATGDLAVPDGRGGIRILGRVADRIGGSFMIPVADVENELLEHPSVEEVAVVGWRDGACAVVVPAGAAPTLAELRQFLTAQGMTDWYQPIRLELVSRLPHEATGKVSRERLRRWLIESRPVGANVA